MSWAGREASDFSRVFKAAAVIDSFQPVLQEIAEDIIAPSIQANFDAGGRPAWRALSPVTIERKSRTGARSPEKILVHSGAMEQRATDPDNYKISDQELRAAPYGIPYWGYHQVGEGVPRRVIMMLQAADRTRITRAFANYIRMFMVFDPRKRGGRQFTGGGL